MGGRTFVETYSVADRAWELTTNWVGLLATARESFPDGIAAPNSPPDLRLRVHVTDRAGSGPWQRPICRGRDDFAFCCFGDESAILFDYRRRIATGSVTRAVAEDIRYWREIVFPFALGVMSPVMGAVPLHAACIRYRDRGVLIGARSGAGKSTVAATLARRGIEFISDDWVYLTAHNGLRVHALPVPLKLLPDATRFFPELQFKTSTQAQNGEWSIALDPAEAFGARRGYRCEPRVVILYDRVPGRELCVRSARTEDLLDWFSEPLDCVPACLETARQEQIALIRRLACSECYVVTCDGTPDEIADHLLRVCEGKVHVDAAETRENTSGIEHLDLLRRGEPTPHVRISDIGGIAAAIRTNDFQVLGQFPAADLNNPEIQLTVVTESQPWPGPALSTSHQCDSVGYVSLGSEGFIAFDAEQREIAAFVGESAVGSGRVHQELRRLCHQLAGAATVTQ